MEQQGFKEVIRNADYFGLSQGRVGSWLYMIYITGGEVMIEIPVWQKYVLSIEEASAYFRIGENKLRRICEEGVNNQTFVLRNGNRTEIKRLAFEKWIDNATDV